VHRAFDNDPVRAVQLTKLPVQAEPLVGLRLLSTTRLLRPRHARAWYVWYQYPRPGPVHRSASWKRWPCTYWHL
jgi:hypothetical protein